MVKILNHPLIEHKMSQLRSIHTKTKEFRELVSEIATLVTYELSRDFQTKTVEVTTPIVKTKCQELKEEVVLIPVLRAGLGMVEGVCSLIPTAKIGHIGLYRDEETLEPKKYFFKVPENTKNSLVIVLDPMLATGHSAAYAIQALKEIGVKNIRYAGIVGCPEGIKLLQEKHPDVDIYLAQEDKHLNENGYIVPGLGDCGDRLFGTK